MENNKYGLTSKEAEESLKKYGNNKLSAKETQTFWQMFLESFKDKWIIILLAALCVKIFFNFIAMLVPSLGNADWYDAVSILFAILLSTGFSTVSSYRNEQKFNALQEEASRIKAKVYRDGVLTELMVDDIVKGDAILLQSGDKVPVDGYILKGSLKVDQAALNGESEEASKKGLGDADLPSGDDLFTELKVFRGSVVMSGEAVIIATEIGDATVLGGINTAIQEDSKESPSKEKLGKLANNIGILGYTGGAVSLIINMVVGITALTHTGTMTGGNFVLLLMESIMLGVSIVIMAVPEGLPMMLALVSSMNSGKLLARHILVRHSDTIETAGYMNILFSDKTGTITEGKLSVVEMILGDASVVQSLSGADDSVKQEIVNGIGLNNDAAISSDGEAIGSNSTDRALLSFLAGQKELGFNKDSIASRKAFSSATKFASVTTKDGVTYIKGAPEYLLDGCTGYIASDGSVKELDAQVRANLDNACTAQAKRAMRLLAVIKETAGHDGRVLIAIVCIRDNVREGIDKTVDVMNKAGVQVVMVTGDRLETACAIAKEAGILKNPEDLAITHSELDSFTDEQLKEKLPHIKVVSRALPMDKRRLVKCAQELGLVAGMTGDGVNDAPALKAADVGFSVGSGTETAKEASDIVILNNSLASIEKAVLYGRTMSKSVSKFIIFQLTVNVSTIALACIAPLFGWAEPFTIVQILWINLIMDTLAALAFGEEPALDRYMDEKPVSRGASILTGYMKSAIGTAAVFITVVCLMILTNAFGIQSVITGGDAADSSMTVRTFMFSFFIYAVIFNSLNTRSNGFNLFEHIGENKRFIAVMCGIAIAQTLIIEFGGQVFGTVPMSGKDFVIALCLAFLIIPVDLARKAVRGDAKK